MTLEISPLRASDAETIGPLQRRIWRETYGSALPDGFGHLGGSDAEAVLAWRERGALHERLGRSPEGASTQVARLDGVPVGWASVGPARDDDAPTPIELWSLYLAPEQQGSGIARRLLDTVAVTAPMHLWVLDGNARAIAFYRRVGFVEDGVRRGLGDSGVDEVRMVRPA